MTTEELLQLCDELRRHYYDDGGVGEVCSALRTALDDVERLTVERDEARNELASCRAVLEAVADAPLQLEIMKQNFERLTAELAALRQRCNDTEHDGTDAACPAWWRGNDRGVDGACEQLTKVLNGDVDDPCYGSAKLTELAKAIAALRQRVNAKCVHDLVKEWSEQTTADYDTTCPPPAGDKGG